MNRIFADFDPPEPDDDDDDEAIVQAAPVPHDYTPQRNAERKRITRPWRILLLEWLESAQFHGRVHDVEMTALPNGVVTIIANLDDEGGEQVRFKIDNGNDA
jgi:hypothetical protein